MPNTDQERKLKAFLDLSIDEPVQNVVLLIMFVAKMEGIAQKKHDVLDFFTIGHTGIMQRDGRLFVAMNHPEMVIETIDAYIDWLYENYQEYAVRQDFNH